MKNSEESETATPVSYEARPLGQALDFLRVLWAINHGLATTSRYMKSKYGVTGRQRLIIQVVNEFPGISAGDLAKVLAPRSQHPDRRASADEPARPAAASARCARSPPAADPADHQGQRMSHMAVGTIEAAVSKTLSRVSPSKLKATREVLALLADNLDRHAEGRAARRSRDIRVVFLVASYNFC